MHANATKTSVQKKLSHLILLPEKSDGFVNLSEYSLARDQKEFLNLCLKCQYSPGTKKSDKTAELEMLYRKLCNLHKEGMISVNPDLNEQLQAESTKRRSFGRDSLPLNFAKRQRSYGRITI